MPVTHHTQSGASYTFPLSCIFNFFQLLWFFAFTFINIFKFLPNQDQLLKFDALFPSHCCHFYVLLLVTCLLKSSLSSLSPIPHVSLVVWIQEPSIWLRSPVTSLMSHPVFCFQSSYSPLQHLTPRTGEN